MCGRIPAIQKIIPKPIAMDLDDVGDVPGVAPISANSLLLSHVLESEGDIWGNNNYNDDASIAHERANLVTPNFNGNEGVQPTPNITQAPERAHRRTRGKAKEYPPAVWRRGADRKLKRISLSVIRKEYKKLNRDMFALTFSQQDISPMAQTLEFQAIPLQHQEIW